MKKVTLLLMLVGLILTTLAQDDKALIKQLVTDNRDAVEALILYPQEDREAILIAASHPEVIVRMDALQSRTQREFETLIANLPQQEQDAMYNLSRYPDLLQALSDGGKPSKRDLKDLAYQYPEDIKGNLVDYGRSHYELLVGINDLYLSSEASFRTLIRDYPIDAQRAFSRLLKMPDALSILNENMSLTVLVGDVYKEDPEWVRSKADSMLVEIAKKKEADIQAWKEYLEENPEAREEFMKSAGAYAEEYGYDKEQYTRACRETTIINYIYRPYPYWFGYPYWHPYPVWYRYPWWYDWGFYYNNRQEIVIIGLPSYHFTHWYFYYPHHHYYYPHLSNSFIYYHHHAHHRHSGTYRAVDNWIYAPRNPIGTNLIQEKNNELRVEKLREYGKLEMELKAYNDKNPQRQVTREEFYNRNRNEYKVLKLETGELQRQPAQQRIQETPRQEQMARPPIPSPNREVKEPVKPFPTREMPKKIERAQPMEKQKVNRPEEYHRNRWENVNTQQKNTAPSTRPKQQQTPRKETPQQEIREPKKSPPKIQQEKPGKR